MSTNRKVREAAIEPAFLSIDATAEYLHVSPWSVKELLRRHVLRAKKAGRRTLVEFGSVRAYAQSLPTAEFAPSRRAKMKAA